MMPTHAENHIHEEHEGEESSKDEKLRGCFRRDGGKLGTER